MGRYYTMNNGEQGKFSFALQSSTKPEEFGGYETSNGYITYHFSNDNLEELEGSIERLTKTLGNDTHILDGYFEQNGTYSDDKITELLDIKQENTRIILSDYFDLQLAQKIHACVESEGYCDIECEL